MSTSHHEPRRHVVVMIPYSAPGFHLVKREVMEKLVRTGGLRPVEFHQTRGSSYLANYGYSAGEVDAETGEYLWKVWPWLGLLPPDLAAL